MTIAICNSKINWLEYKTKTKIKIGEKKNDWNFDRVHLNPKLSKKSYNSESEKCQNTSIYWTDKDKNSDLAKT